MKEATVWFTAARQERQLSPGALLTTAVGRVGAPELQGVGAPELQGNVIICTVTRPRAGTPLNPVTYITAQHCAVFRYPASPLSPRLPRFPAERSPLLGASSVIFTENAPHKGAICHPGRPRPGLQ